MATGGPFEKELSVVDIAKNISKIDYKFPFLGKYEFEKEVALISSDLQTAASAMLSVGCRLIRLKEHEVHGKFIEAVQRTGISRSAAKRFMSCAVRFIEADTGKVKYPQLVQLSTTKIYDLVMLDDDDLKVLDEGGSVADLKLDEAEKLSTRELRKKVREITKEREALQQVIDAKNQKCDELEKKLRIQDSHIPTREEIQKKLQEHSNEILMLSADCNLLVTKAREIMKRLADIKPEDSDKALFRTVYDSLKAATLNMSEEVSRVAEEVETTIPSYFGSENIFTILNK